MNRRNSSLGSPRSVVATNWATRRTTSPTEHGTSPQSPCWSFPGSRDPYPTFAPSRFSRSAPEKNPYTSMIVWTTTGRKIGYGVLLTKLHPFASFDFTLVVGSAAGENRRPPGEACAVLLAPAGRRASDPAAVRRHAAEDLGATGAGRLTPGLSATKSAWRRKSIGVERCLRDALKAGARVGSTSSAASTGSDATCDEEIWRAERRVGV